jgi:hypothetical protein
MVKRIRKAGRVTRKRSPGTPYALNYGEYVVAVKHLLDVFTSQVTTVL